MTNNVHTATVKNDRRLTKRLPLNRATGAIHHYLAGRPVRALPPSSPALSIQLALSFSHVLSSPSLRLLPFGGGRGGSVACDSIISRLRFSGAIPQETTYSRQVARTIEFIKGVGTAAVTVDGYERFTIAAGGSTSMFTYALCAL